MNETLQKWLEKAKVYFDQFSKSRKILIGSVAGLIVVGLMAMVLLLRRDPMQVLYSDLKPEDSKAVAKKLSEQNIQYYLSSDNETISVASSQVYRARMELAKEGLPGQDVVGFEKFDSSTIGMSSYVQRIQYVRAVQGELTRSIQRLAAVKTARVHISVPPKKTFLEEEEPPKASVVLELRPGMAPTKPEIAGIAHLVASAVEGLKVSQISIVDTKGSFLFRPEDSGQGGVPTAMLEMQRGIEVEYERRVEEILTPVVGFGKVRAKVTAEIDPSRSNTTEESFDPDKTVARTMNKVDELQNGARPNPIGIPGSRSNLPGTENNNPPTPMATNTNEKNTSNATYAIPRKISVVDRPSGSIKRLTVAVVVDGNYAKANGATTETFAPRSEEELRRLQDLVANAVGFDAERRDSITVSSLPFQTADLNVPEEKPLPWFHMEELSKHGIRNGVTGLVFLMFFFLVLRPFLKWVTGVDEKKKAAADAMKAMVPKTVEELEAAVLASEQAGQTPEQAAESLLALAQGQDSIDLAAAAEGAAMAADNANKEGDSGEAGENPEKEVDLKTRIMERLEQSPKKGFRIIQEWLEDESGPQVAEG